MRAVILEDALGWYHEAPGSRGVVLLGAFGYEDLCFRRTGRLLADQLCDAGVPVLRLDLRDTGDSADLPPDADRAAAWIDDAVRAIVFMRDVVGCAEIVLIGARLGAVIAPFAAARAGGVDHLVLLAPPLNGRAHMRELGLVGRMLDAASGIVEDLPDGLSVGGFRLSGQTVAGLSALDPDKQLAAWPARQVTLIGDMEAQTLARIAARFPDAGVVPRVLPFYGYSRMMCDPTASEPALDTIADLVAILKQAQPAARLAPFPLSPAVLVADGYEEEPFVFHDGLVGVLCRPSGGRKTIRAAIWFNAGRNYHIGWGRQTVDQSRRLAREGVAVLRMDFAGIGDSPARAATPPVALYHEDGRTDVDAAIEEMERRGYNQVTLIGVCSGGNQAFHAAGGNTHVDGLVLVNLLCFQWDESYRAEFSGWLSGRAEAFDAETQDTAGGGSPAAGLLTRFMDLVRPVARPVRNRLRSHFNSVRLRLNGGGPVVRKFRGFAARGLPVSVVVSAGDKSVVELERHAGPGGEQIAHLPGVELVTIEGADHSLSPLRARLALGDHLVERLARRKPVADAAA